MSAPTATPERAATPPHRHRLGENVGGWRVGLRLARRDMLAYRGRTALVLLLIGLPVALMVFGLVAWSTAEVDDREAVPARFGSAQALVFGRSNEVARLGVRPWAGCDAGGMVMGATGMWALAPKDEDACSDGSTGGAAAVPGLAPGASLAQAGAALGALTHARAVPVGRSGFGITRGRDRITLDELNVDGADPAAGGMVTLTSGRWATAPNEVVVTPFGQHAGLPASGTVAVETWQESQESTDKTVTSNLTIVGTADVATGTSLDGETPAAVGPAPTRLEGTSFLLARDAPMSWDEVQRLAGHGLLVVSRAVTLGPPPAAVETERAFDDQSDGIAATIVAVIVLGVVVEAALLAGPAFAVIGAARRRSLALAAANGASRAQLRTAVLAQALVLGLGAALFGLVLGVAGAAGVVAAARHYSPGDPKLGPFDVPGLRVAFVVLAATAAAVVAAVVPARGLSRLEITTALRGDVVSGRVHRGMPILGVVLAAAGTVGVFVGTAWARDLGGNADPALVVVVVSGIALVVGMLLLVPTVLVGLAALAAPFGVATRIAWRDVTRRRGRAVPTVAAAMCSAILLSGIGIVWAAYDAESAQRYDWKAPLGWARISSDLDVEHPERGAVDRAALDAAVAQVPGARVHVMSMVKPALDASQQDAENPAVPVTALVPSGCTEAQTVASVAAQLRASEAQGTCPGVVFGYGDSLAVVSPDDARALFGLDDARLDVLRRGGILLDHDTSLTAGVLATGTLEAPGGWPAEGSATWRGTRTRVAVPVTGFEAPRFAWNGFSGRASGFVTPETARALGLTSRPEYFVEKPGGLTDADTARLEALATVPETGFPTSSPGEVHVYIERGYQTPLWVPALLLGLTGLLILVATVTSTALAMTEQARDLATLAAVGAPDRVRRRVAAVQAAGLAAVGTLVGMLVGAVPGVAVSHLGLDLVVIPWPMLLGALVGVPLLAAACAALLVPRRPTLTRREG